MISFEGSNPLLPSLQCLLCRLSKDVADPFSLFSPLSTTSDFQSSTYSTHWLNPVLGKQTYWVTWVTWFNLHNTFYLNVCRIQISKAKKNKTKQYFLHIYTHTHVCIYINYIHTCESRVLTPTMQWLLQLLPCVITDALSTVSSVVHSSPTPICFCHESCAQAVQRGVTIRGAPRLCTITARTDLSLAKTCVYYSSPPIQLNMQTVIGLGWQPGSLLKLQERRFRRGADSFCTRWFSPPSQRSNTSS